MDRSPQRTPALNAVYRREGDRYIPSMGYNDCYWDPRYMIHTLGTVTGTVHMLQTMTMAIKEIPDITATRIPDVSSITMTIGTDGQDKHLMQIIKTPEILVAMINMFNKEPSQVRTYFCLMFICVYNDKAHTN